MSSYPFRSLLLIDVVILVLEDSNTTTENNEDLYEEDYSVEELDDQVDDIEYEIQLLVGTQSFMLSHSLGYFNLLKAKLFYN